MLDWLRRYKLPSLALGAVALTELVKSDRVSVVASGNLKAEELMKFYCEEEGGLPLSRQTRWEEFIRN